MRTEEPRAIRLRIIARPITTSPKLRSISPSIPTHTRHSDDEGRAQRRQDAPLVLNGEHLKLVSVAIDGKPAGAIRISIDR